jgi:hypothetical protein
MLKDRKWSAVPDPSFDLDGDGHVSHKDLFLAKHFDLDRDGKLNESEKKLAREALSNGFDKNFLFGLERAGLNDEIRNSGQDLKYIRIMQKHGKIIQGEDYSVLERPQTVCDTRRPRTRQELHERRRQQSLRELEGAFTLCPTELQTKRYSSQERLSQAESPARTLSKKEKQNHDSFFGQATGKISEVKPVDYTYVDHPAYNTKALMVNHHLQQER